MTDYPNKKYLKMLIFVENVIVGKPMDAMINIDATHNFILVEEAK